MEQAEFSERILAMQDTLYRVATTILPRLCDREDAVQEALETAWRMRGKLRDDGALRAWVVRILINRCYALLRKRRREQLSDDPAAREVAPDATPDLYRMFTSLEEKYRLPMVLRYVEGYDMADIARMLRMPQGTLKSRLFRGRALLRDVLNDEGEEGARV